MTHKINKIVEDLNKDGISIVRNLLDPRKVKFIKRQVDESFKNNKNLGKAVNVAQLSPEDLMTYGESRKNVENKYENFYLTKEDFEKGLDHYSKLTTGISIEEPLQNINGLDDIIFNNRIKEVATKYFEQEPKLGYTKVRKFFVNDLPEFDTNYFHIDDNSDKLIKAIVYLNDINEDSVGNFAFVKGSHTDTMPAKEGQNPYLKADEEIISYYGKEKIVRAFGNIGDVIFVNTLGYHKGEKIRKGDRNVLYVNLVLKEEYDGKGPKLKIKKATYNNLNEEQKRFGEFLDIVD